jgi:hypothetical protein
MLLLLNVGKLTIFGASPPGVGNAANAMHQTTFNNNLLKAINE